MCMGVGSDSFAQGTVTAHATPGCGTNVTDWRRVHSCSPGFCTLPRLTTFNQSLLHQVIFIMFSTVINRRGAVAALKKHPVWTQGEHIQNDELTTQERGYHVVGYVNPTIRHHCFHPEYLDTKLIGMDLAEGEWKHLRKLFEGARNTRRPIS